MPADYSKSGQTPVPLVVRYHTESGACSIADRFWERSYTHCPYEIGEIGGVERMQVERLAQADSIQSEQE